MQTIIDFVKAHLVIVLGAIAAAWFFLFSGKKGGRRSSYRRRARSYGKRSYSRGRNRFRGRSRRRY